MPVQSELRVLPKSSHRIKEAKLNMKKAKTLEVKLRSAIRLIWSRSAERRAILKAAQTEHDSDGTGEKGFFECPECKRHWPIQMAEVDHEPPIGTLVSWRDTVNFIDKMFYGPQRALCKLCHKKKTAAQRRKAI